MGRDIERTLQGNGFGSSLLPSHWSRLPDFRLFLGLVWDDLHDDSYGPLECLGLANEIVCL